MAILALLIVVALFLHGKFGALDTSAMEGCDLRQEAGVTSAP